MTYANGPFKLAQRSNIQTAEQIGQFDTVYAHGPRDIHPAFYLRHWRTLVRPRGAGFWLWKPYFIVRHLEEMSVGSWLFYCDSGAYFVAPIRELVQHANDHALDVVVFQLSGDRLERHWTKRDAFLALDADKPEIADAPQRAGGYHLWRKNETALELAEQWLAACADRRLLVDSPSRAANYPGFIEHRHDQSLLSLITKSRRIPAWREPSQFGWERRNQHPDCSYPQIIVSTRARSTSRLQRIRDRQMS